MMNYNTPALAATSNGSTNITKLHTKNSTSSKQTVIPIDEDYRITGNRFGWTVEKIRKRSKTQSWDGISYHGKLDAACNSLWELMVRTSGAIGLAEVLLARESALTRISQALSVLYDVKFHSDE